MSTPYYEQDGITIYHGDCREILPTLTPNWIDALITDPPYAIVNTFGTQQKTNGKRTLQFSWDGDGVFTSVMEGLVAAMGVLADDAGAMVFCGFDTVTPTQCVLRGNGFTPKPYAWVKTYPPPAMPGNWWPSGFEVACYGYRPGAFFADASSSRVNIFKCDTYRHGQPGKVDHPTQKPLKLMRHIVKSIVPDDGWCIDPFCGSGSTLVASKQEGRRAIGIEISERFCEISANRLRQGILFGMGAA